MSCQNYKDPNHLHLTYSQSSSSAKCSYLWECGRVSIENHCRRSENQKGSRCADQTHCAVIKM